MSNTKIDPNVELLIENLLGDERDTFYHEVYGVEHDHDHRPGWLDSDSQDRVVTYTFLNAPPDYVGRSDSSLPSRFETINDANRTQINYILDFVETFADVKFVYVEDDSMANIRYGTISEHVGSFGAGPTAAEETSGDVWLDTRSYLGADGDVIVHETGHALGLNHPDIYLYNIPNRPVAKYDSQQYSVMSYFSETKTGGDSPSDYNTIKNSEASLDIGFLLADIAALQVLYGANTESTSGDSVYGFNVTDDVHGLYDFAALDSHNAPNVTIWDSGGVDKLDLSGYATDSVLNLNQGAFSSAGRWSPSWLQEENHRNVVHNISIAYGAVIENGTTGSGNDTLIGNEVDNVLLAGAGNDTIDGGDGDDTLSGGWQHDNLNGGNGNDTVDYSLDSDERQGHGGSGYYINLRIGETRTISGNILADTLTSIENAVGSDKNDKLRGDGGANILDGGDGNDILAGGNGDDHLDGGDGNDRLYGQNDNDTVYGGAGRDYINAGNGDDVVYGGDDNDTIYGASGNDTIHGGAGNEWIRGGNDNDKIYGDAGNDRVFGEHGDDTIHGGDGNDRLEGGIGNDILVGNNGNDRLDGGDGNDRLYGQNGNDTVYGGAGRDYINVGNGNDVVYGGNDNDVIYGASGNDTIHGGAGNEWIRGGNDNDKIYGDAGNDRVFGEHGNDALYGGDGNDTLEGGIGNDRLDGGAGNDRLNGGDDADVFVFSTGGGRDTILNFNQGEQDRIDLSGHNAVSNFNQLQLSQDGNNVVITGIGTDEITINNVTLDTLTEDQFIF